MSAGPVQLCDADLTMTTLNTALPVRDSLLAVQLQILDLLAGRPSKFPLYAHAEPSPSNVLSDIKSIAGWVISTIDHTRLEQSLRPTVIDADDADRCRDTADNPSIDSASTVHRIATGITVAAAALSRPDTAAAATLFAQLMRISRDPSHQLVSLPRTTLTAAPRLARDQACRQLSPRPSRRASRFRARW